jgi:hypothetical protein
MNDKVSSYSKIRVVLYVSNIPVVEIELFKNHGSAELKCYRMQKLTFYLLELRILIHYDPDRELAFTEKACSCLHKAASRKCAPEVHSRRECEP